MKLFLVIFMFLLTGCGAVSRSVASLSGYDITCVHGVSYIQFTSGVTVEYTPEGKIKTCQ